MLNVEERKMKIKLIKGISCNKIKKNFVENLPSCVTGGILLLFYYYILLLHFIIILVIVIRKIVIVNNDEKKKTNKQTIDPTNYTRILYD